MLAKKGIIAASIVPEITFQSFLVKDTVLTDSQSETEVWENQVTYISGHRYSYSADPD